MRKLNPIAICFLAGNHAYTVALVYDVQPGEDYRLFDFDAIFKSYQKQD